MDVKHQVYLLPERHTHTHTHTMAYTNPSTLYTIYKQFKQVEQSLTEEDDISVHEENMAGLVYCCVQHPASMITEITIPSYRIGHFVFIYKARVHYAIIAETVNHSL